ncbi:MAG: M48 family metalloprotease [Pseudomonadota bacterium]
MSDRMCGVQMGAWLKEMWLRVILGVVIAATAPAVSSAWTFTQSGAGKEGHQAVLARHGGVYNDPDLADYLTALGQRLAAETDEPPEEWEFTLLDSSDIAAFARPGGYIYVTRGLMAFASSEAGLATVLAHQMAHALKDHFDDNTRPSNVPDRGLAPGALLDGLIGGTNEVSSPPPTDRVTGERPVFTREMEVAAAAEGVRILADAGYPAHLAVSFANRLLDFDELSRKLNGRSEVDLFGRTSADKIATVQEIGKVAEAFPRPIIDVDYSGPYLSVIEGLTYGESPTQGFLRDQSFIHPDLRFTFELPEGFSAEISAAEVAARGPNGALMVLDTTNEAGDRLESYIRDKWAPSLTRSVNAGYLFDLTSRTIGGFEAASAFQPYDDAEGAKVAQLVVIRTDRRVYRFRAIASAEAFDVSLLMEEAIDSFQEIPVAVAARYKPYWIQIHEVRQGDSLNILTAAMPFREGAEEFFRALNNYPDRAVPMVGDRIKIVMEE